MRQCSIETNTELYADDTVAHAADKRLQTVETKLQISALKFDMWCIDHNVLVNWIKTNAMIIGTSHMTSGTKNVSIPVNEHEIEIVNTQKHLGILIDKNLTWEEQISQVCQGVSRKLTLMKLLSKYVNQDSLKLYYNSYVLPIFDFCCIIWGNTTIGNQARLVKLQKRAARIILKVDILTPSEEMFKRLGWLSFPKRVQYHTCLMVYKSINGMTPDYISSMLTLVSDHHERQTRQSSNDKLHVPRSRTSYFDKAFSISGPRLWNTLPAFIRESNTIFKFKRGLKQYLLQNE